MNMYYPHYSSQTTEFRRSFGDWASLDHAIDDAYGNQKPNLNVDDNLQNTLLTIKKYKKYLCPSQSWKIYSNWLIIFSNREKKEIPKLLQIEIFILYAFVLKNEEKAHEYNFNTAHPNFNEVEWVFRYHKWRSDNLWEMRIHF